MKHSTIVIRPKTTDINNGKYVASIANRYYNHAKKPL